MCKNSVIFNIIRVVFNIFCIFFIFLMIGTSAYEYFLLLRGEYIFGTNFVRAVYHTSTCVYTEIGLFGSYFDTHIDMLTFYKIIVKI